MKVIFLILIIAAIAAAQNQTEVKRSVQVVCPVADGCTNSGAALNNGRLMYSASGAIIEAPKVFSTGTTVTIGYTSVSTAMNYPTRLNLQGALASQANGPNIQAYVSSDAHPAYQLFTSYHDDMNESWDLYSNGANWVASNAFAVQWRKYNGEYLLRIASGLTVGSTFSTFTDVFKTTTTGHMRLGVGLYLPDTLSLAVPLTINIRQSVTITTSGAFAGSATILASRSGDQVTLTFKALTGTVSSSNSLRITVLGVLDQAFYPKGLGATAYAQRWVVPTNDSGSDQNGRVIFYGKRLYVEPTWDEYAYFEIYSANGASFSAGSSRGYANDFSISYYAQ